MSTPSCDDPSGLRLDIWLWRARFFKTRTLAANCVRKGRLRVHRHGQTTRIRKPHFGLLPGDQIMFLKGHRVFYLEVLDLGQRRGPAREAASLYRDLGVQESGSAAS